MAAVSGADAGQGKAETVPVAVIDDLTGCGKSRSVVLPAQFVAFCPFVTR